MTAPLPRSTDPTPLAATMLERACPTYFGRAGRRLFGWYHAAAGAAPRDVVAVLCAPVGSEHETTGSPRALRHWAEQLAASGIGALRFDYYGTGDSAGVGEDGDQVREWIDSIGDAIELARANSGARHVVLVGVRLGATLAITAAAERGNVAALILWAGFPTGKACLREARAFARLRSSPKAGDPGSPGGNEQLGGHLLSAQTVAALAALDPFGGNRAIAAHALVIPRDESASDTALVQRLTTAGVVVAQAPVTGYMAMSADAHSSAVPHAVIDATTAWLTDKFPAVRSKRRRPSGAASSSTALELRSPEGAAFHSVVETPERFGEQSRLFGVLTRPAGTTRRRTAVLLANAGSVHHIGPNRLYVSLAREWAGLGYTVLRMDIGGVGESAPPAGVTENHPYPRHAVTDVAAGVARLRELGAERIVLAGLCSGAHTTFHAGLALPGIDGVLLVNPIVFYWKASDSLDSSAWFTYNESQNYLRSARQWKSWLRLFSNKVSVSRIARVGFARVQAIVGAKAAAVARRFRAEPDVAENPARDLTRLTDRGTDVLLLFSASEPGHNHLRLNYAREIRKLGRRPTFRLRQLDGADHTFTDHEARRRAIGALTEHLLAKHP